MNNLDPKFLEKLKDDILDHLSTGAEKFAHKIASIINDKTREVIGEKSFAEGNLQNSVRSEVRKLAGEYLIRIFTTAPYAKYIYDGSRPHYPPIAPIIQWVRKKGLTNNYSANSQNHPHLRSKVHSKNYVQYPAEKIIAEKIAWKIHKKGTQGIKFFDIALKQALPGIESELENYPFMAAI